MGFSLMTRTGLKIIGLALACFLAGWLFGSNQSSPGASTSSTGRWVMTGPGNVILLNTLTGDTWKFYADYSNGSGFNYMPKPPTRPYSDAPGGCD